MLFGITERTQTAKRVAVKSNRLNKADCSRFAAAVDDALGGALSSMGGKINGIAVDVRAMLAIGHGWVESGLDTDDGIGGRFNYSIREVSSHLPASGWRHKVDPAKAELFDIRAKRWIDEQVESGELSPLWGLTPRFWNETDAEGKYLNDVPSPESEGLIAHDGKECSPSDAAKKTRDTVAYMVEREIGEDEKAAIMALLTGTDSDD